MDRLASVIGEVKLIAYDQRIEYVRVLVKLNIVSPARKTKKLEGSTSGRNLCTSSGTWQVTGHPGFPPLQPGFTKELWNIALQYVSHADPTESQARVIRVQQPMEENSTESRPKPPKITTHTDKGKGHVFGFEDESDRLKRDNIRNGKSTISEFNEHTELPIQWAYWAGTVTGWKHRDNSSNSGDISDGD